MQHIRLPLMAGAIAVVFVGLANYSRAESAGRFGPGGSRQATNAPSPTATATPWPTNPPARAASSHTAATPIPDTDLVAHFERVTEKVLNLTNIAIYAITVIVGLVGGLVGIFGYKTLTEVREMAAELAGMREAQDKLQMELERAEKISQNLQNRYRYLVECRDPNPETRKRAVQQLAYSKDIAVIPLVVEVLENDSNEDVRAEATFALGKLLSQTHGTIPKGSDALISATKDSSFKVRVQAAESLELLIRNGVPLPRDAYQRLKEIANVEDNDSELAKVADRALAEYRRPGEEHGKAPREKG